MRVLLSGCTWYLSHETWVEPHISAGWELGGVNVIIIDFTHCLHSSLPPHTDQRALLGAVWALCTKRQRQSTSTPAPAPSPVSLSDRFQQIWRVVVMVVVGILKESRLGDQHITDNTLIKSSLDTSSLSELSCQSALARERSVLVYVVHIPGFRCVIFVFHISLPKVKCFALWPNCKAVEAW